MINLCNSIGLKKNSARAVLLIVLSISSCDSDGTFKSSKSSDGGNESVKVNAPVLGQNLGQKATDPSQEALEIVYLAVSDIPPASIRADPDTYARNLILQYRSEGAQVAREVGGIVNFRLLLGGASEDFQKPPQENFDATSLLASMTVAKRVCFSLVNPDRSRYPEWTSILPASPEDWSTNIIFLGQRLLGIPSSDLSPEKIAALKLILDTSSGDESLNYSHYVDVCAALALDAQALMF